MMRANVTSNPKYSASPAITPAIMRFERERLSGGCVLIGDSAPAIGFMGPTFYCTPKPAGVRRCAAPAGGGVKLLVNRHRVGSLVQSGVRTVCAEAQDGGDDRSRHQQAKGTLGISAELDQDRKSTRLNSSHVK